MSRRQEDYESVAEYASALQNLFRLAFSDNENPAAQPSANDPILRNIFLQGLKPEVHEKLAFERLSTFDEAKVRAMTIEATLTNMRHRQMIRNHEKIPVRSVNQAEMLPATRNVVV